MSIDFTFGGTLRIPLIVAPMFLVSTPAMALAACGRGVMGSFPAHSTRTREGFADWLSETENGLKELDNPAPFAVNLVVHPTNDRYPGDLDLCIQHKVPVILTSKGAPKDAFSKIHDYGGLAFHDVGSARHAEKAAAAGADALIAVTQGAGGHTGTINPFALLNEIRDVTDKPIILSGCLGTGADLLSAQTMGASLSYMGTRFLAAKESGADDKYRDLLVEAKAKDVFYSAALDGAPANWMTKSLIEQGIDLDELATTIPGQVMASGKVKERYSKVRTCGQGVGVVKKVETMAEICDSLISEYDQALSTLRDRISA